MPPEQQTMLEPRAGATRETPEVRIPVPDRAEAAVQQVVYSRQQAPVSCRPPADDAIHALREG